MKICVFCGSSVDLEPIYYEHAREMGHAIGKNGHSIIYGAGKIGIMGAVASAVREQGGETTGVIPERLKIRGVVSDEDDKLIITKDMKDRKALMRQEADAFLALPGGFGTLEELLEVITLKQLQYHKLPVVILNTDGYYDALLQLFEQMYTHKFAVPEYRSLYTMHNNPAAALSAIENYAHADVYDKYLKR
ncbi:MAG: TIGR00730 family Rossman fold protein [Bacteroidota bacterium]